MKKADIISKLAEVETITKTEAQRRLDTIFDILSDGLVEDGSVVLPKIGKLIVAHVPAKSGVSKLSGEEVAWNKEACNKLKFKPTTKGNLTERIQ